MDSWPKISVVVATKNRARYLNRMLDALFADDYPNREVIIVDGASTDGTVELLKSYGDRITRWVSEPDEGEYFAYNKALGVATGEIIKVMTDDDVLRPGALRVAARYFAEHPEVDILFGQTAVWDERARAALCVKETRVTDASKLTLRNWLRGSQGVKSVAAFVRRKVFNDIGLFATGYSCGDTEFWARAASKGNRMGVVVDVVVDRHLTEICGVFLKRGRLRWDGLRVNVRYGTAANVGWYFNARYLKPYTYGAVLQLLASACHTLGLHPLRVWRRGRRRVEGSLHGSGL